MKKYFMYDTESEVNFGETIIADYAEDNNGTTVHKHFECVFSPNNVKELLERDIIEEVDVPDEEEDNEQHTPEELFTAILEGVIENEKALTEQVKALKGSVDLLRKQLASHEK